MDAFNDNIEQIKSKIGEENSALISEELIDIMSSHKTIQDNLAAKEQEITSLKKEKDELIQTNGKLFLKLGKEKEIVDHFQSAGDDTKPNENVEIKIGDIINSNGDIL